MYLSLVPSAQAIRSSPMFARTRGELPERGIDVAVVEMKNTRGVDSKHKTGVEPAAAHERGPNLLQTADLERQLVARSMLVAVAMMAMAQQQREQHTLESATKGKVVGSAAMQMSAGATAPRGAAQTGSKAKKVNQLAHKRKLTHGERLGQKLGQMLAKHITQSLSVRLGQFGQAIGERVGRLAQRVICRERTAVNGRDTR